MELEAEGVVMTDPDKLQAIIEAWEADPASMFDWRSKTLKLAMLTLESIIREPHGQGRARDLSRIRAIAQLQSLTTAMETMRASIPVVCPACDHEFVLR